MTVELSPERTDIQTAEESEFLSDPVVALSVRIVIATLSSFRSLKATPAGKSLPEEELL